MFMKIATDRESIVAIQPIHNARAAPVTVPGRALNQYADEGKEILLLFQPNANHAKNSARTKKHQPRKTDHLRSIVPSTAACHAECG
jgi:hypothetical protein